jgi:hypothetical protein
VGRRFDFCDPVGLLDVCVAAATAGRSIESRAPEKSDDKAAFAGQARAPHHPTGAPVVTTLTGKLKLP